ncbi:LysR substrate-binding domain-containing protein [Corynebacterium pelargi]|uniref:Probable hydrogen peroxide-inducible genes activator n=1 Tax=Corynebacterium pelargi TaxID=1471400 RepID=A0A410W8D9_9CORY|nr:LysR substrate-binding domain-containing protein [Corynebacterium pelargi]QAU52224.1 putative hydrogen peroxide-inducible genes activator [Corynebacterium pelargi]GGG69245.1 transcriptional regulator [Corynebacterium pelargi]
MNYKEYRPTLAQLRTYVTVAETKHFGAAASRLDISQPSLSQALAAIEHGLGVQLIERSTRKVIVTPAGEELLPYAKATLDAVDLFLAHARGAVGTLTGQLTIGIIPTIAPYILPNLLRLAKTTFPDLELRIIEDQTQHLCELLRDGHIECALLALPIEDKKINHIPLYHENFHLVVPEDDPYAGRSDLTLEDLRDLNFYLLDDGHCLRDQIVDLCRRADVHPEQSQNASTRAASLTTVIQLVSAGHGATLVPESAISAEGQRPGVATATFNPAVSAEREVAIAYRTSSSSREEEFRQLGALITRAFHEVAQKPQA